MGCEEAAGDSFKRPEEVQLERTHVEYSAPHVKVHSSPWPSVTLD